MTSHGTRSPGLRDPSRRSLVIGAGSALAVLAGAILAVVIARNDDNDGISTDATTEVPATVSPTTAVPTSAVPTTTPATSAAPSSTQPATLSSEEAAVVVWPWPDGATRFDDPVAAAKSFAIDLVGFEAPILGEMRQGDSRSGEVPVRPNATGPDTTVLVRQMSDGNWWVLGSTNESIQLDDPIPGTAIDNPLLLSGRARAFEGMVQVAVYQRGSTRPLGEGFVMGSGTEELGPFTGEVWWKNPGGGWGAVVLHTASGENGQVWQAVAVPVGFIGGD